MSGIDSARLATTPSRAGYDAAVRYLEGLRVSDIRPGLERIEWLCAALGHPERAARVVHVTGTNGKGSTSRLIGSVLRAMGVRTGLYTSPHLERLVERIVVDQVPIDEATFAAAVEQIRHVVERAAGELASAPTHFETLTALGFRVLADAHVTALVLEVGLGGRYDSTNVADGSVAVVTNVALDHTEFLGSTREEIAVEKAGIIKPGAIAIIGEGTPNLRAIFEERCAEVGATPWLIGEHFVLESNVAVPNGRLVTVSTPRARYEDVVVPFHGAHQGHNAACALAALDAFGERAPDVALVRAGFTDVPNPGRFEVVEGTPPVVIDVAHNPHGVDALIATLDELYRDRRRVIVIGINPHKDAEAMLAALVKDARALVATQVSDAPAIPATILAKSAEAAGHAVVHAVPEPRQAIEMAFLLAQPDDVIVCTGSHYWIGMVRQDLIALATGTLRPDRLGADHVS